MRRLLRALEERTCDFGEFFLTGKTNDDIELKGGEEITFLERAAAQPREPQFVRINGAVLNPSQYDLKQGMTLTLNSGASSSTGNGAMRPVGTTNK